MVTTLHTLWNVSWSLLSLTFAMEEEDRPAYESIEMAAEPERADGLTRKWDRIPHLATRKTSESAAPIQGRIDSVLGLAVA